VLGTTTIASSAPLSLALPHRGGGNLAPNTSEQLPLPPGGGQGEGGRAIANTPYPTSPSTAAARPAIAPGVPPQPAAVWPAK